MGNCFSLGELRITLFEFGFEDWIDTIKQEEKTAWIYVGHMYRENRNGMENYRGRGRKKKGERLKEWCMECKEVREARGIREWISLGVLIKEVSSGDTLPLFWMA